MLQTRFHTVFGQSSTLEQVVYDKYIYQMEYKILAQVPGGARDFTVTSQTG